MDDVILDASFTLHWCFEDEATSASDALLTLLQHQKASAWVPAIWPYEILNGLGKGVMCKAPSTPAMAGDTCSPNSHR